MSAKALKELRLDRKELGEVWLRGTNITGGYYKMPKETASEFDPASSRNTSEHQGPPT